MQFNKIFSRSFSKKNAAVVKAVIALTALPWRHAITDTRLITVRIPVTSYDYYAYVLSISSLRVWLTRLLLCCLDSDQWDASVTAS